ncbi:MAG: Uncharacterized protein G01um10147_1136 [Microgenomates group bacterium Gr01-1014_7]|nr:MAG: Uncharacterized protein G01um10147_1136 [Microgenomates group bacterium Gr01-1014_7]
MIDELAKITTIVVITVAQATPFAPPVDGNVLASREISMENRYHVKSVSDIFRDNILLNLAYMDGKVAGRQDVNWDEIKKPFTLSFKLNPGEVFAYHDDILPEYKNKVVRTTNAHFVANEGFKTDGYLFGDGVCHLASLMYWVAKEAGLDALAPVRHDFMAIPEISREYGVSIYSNPYSRDTHTRQNLYIANNKEKPISFKFDYADDKLKVSVSEIN